jgi:hypothetical protein
MHHIDDFLSQNGEKYLLVPCSWHTYQNTRLAMGVSGPHIVTEKLDLDQFNLREKTRHCGGKGGFILCTGSRKTLTMVVTAPLG